MNIGEWLFQMRRKCKFDLRALSVQTGLDIGTISKIENGRTQATLGTIVRAAEALGVTSSQFILDWQGEPFSVTNAEHITGEEAVPTFQDVVALVTYSRSNMQSISTWMAKALDSIASSHGETIPLYKPHIVEKLIFGRPWQRYEVQYPPDMLNEEILDILRQKGILILSDISVYLENIGSNPPITTEKLASLLKIALREASPQEIGSVERIEMVDVLLLDQELKQGGKIIAMFWNVCLFHINIQQLLEHDNDKLGKRAAILTEHKARLVLLLIIICRWLQHISMNDASWILDLRQRLQPPPGVRLEDAPPLNFWPVDVQDVQGEGKIVS